jgi:small subunit ribosomal protein S17
MAETEDPTPETEAPSEAPVPEIEPTADARATSVSEGASVSNAGTTDSAEAAPKPRRKPTARKKAPKQPAALTPEQKREAKVQERRVKASQRRVQRERARVKARAARGEHQDAPAREHGSGKQKTRQGVVVSDRAQKTITVRIDVTHRHPRYSKIVRTSSTLHAHDEAAEAHIGDTVVIRECRPLSRTKRWRLVQVVERAK